MGFIVGFLVSIGIIGAFCAGLYAMYKISEFYNSRIRAAWQSNRSQQHARPPRDPFLTQDEYDRMQTGTPVRKVIK